MQMPTSVDMGFDIKQFEKKNFNVDEYVKDITSRSTAVDNFVSLREKLNRMAEQTAEDIKRSVFDNYSSFMETSKEVGHLESKMVQLRQSLEDQKKVLNLFKSLSVSSSNDVLSANSGDSKTLTDQKSKASLNASNLSNQSQLNTSMGANMENKSLATLLEEVENCGVVAQKPGRYIIYHSDLDVLHQIDFVFLQKYHAYLLNDALLLTSQLRKRAPKNTNKSVTNLDTHQYKFHAFFELQEINITNIEDRKEVRNAFQVLKFPESLIFRCSNAHQKKEWLENIEKAKKKLESEIDRKKQQTVAAAAASNRSGSITGTIPMTPSTRHSSLTIFEEKEEIDLKLFKANEEQEQARNKYVREQFSDFDIYLAQRDFEKAVDLLLRVKSFCYSAQQMSPSSVNQLIYKQKEFELISLLRKDLNTSKERGNKGLMKTGKRVVTCLVKLKIYDEALNLFIDYHKTLSSETLKKIKLEESNSIYMNNVLNTFFDSLKFSYTSFKESFQHIINQCLSTYINWVDTEIEILIRKLESQHYIGRQFDLTIENCELMFERANEFSRQHFEVKFLFEIKLKQILEKSIKDQKDMLVEASLQRCKFEDIEAIATNKLVNSTQTEQTRQIQLQKFVRDLHVYKIEKIRLVEGEYYFEDFNLNNLNASSLQFSRGIVTFFCDLLRIYYQDINYAIIEAIVEMYKGELKMYDKTDKNLKTRLGPSAAQHYKSLTLNNLIFLFNYILPLIEVLYEEKTRVKSRNFAKLHERFEKYKSDNL